MRRRTMHRNTGFRLEPPRPQGRVIEAVANINGLTTLGIVVNPKLKQPLLAVTDGEYVSIRSLLEESFLVRIGRGYPSENREAASSSTGYPRVHTPDGVRPQGLGYGTSLYSALCLGAHLDFEDSVRIRMSKRGNGICSDSRDRSGEADQWWSAAVRRGLADEETDEDTRKEENVDVTSDVDTDDLQRLVGSDERVVSYVNTVSVDFEETESLTFEYVTYDSLTNYSLVCGEVTYKVERAPAGDDVSMLWHAVLDEPDIIGSTYEDALLALDVRGLHEDAISLLSLLYLSEGLKDHDVDAMQERWRQDLDPDAEVRQGHLFRANAAGMADVLSARRATRWSELESLP